MLSWTQDTKSRWLCGPAGFSPTRKESFMSAPYFTPLTTGCKNCRKVKKHNELHHFDHSGGEEKFPVPESHALFNQDTTRLCEDCALELIHWYCERRLGYFLRYIFAGEDRTLKLVDRVQDERERKSRAKSRRKSKRKKRQAIIDQQEGKCQVCKQEITIDFMHIDHITPRSKGGTDMPENLQGLCPPCNINKGANY